MGICRFLCEDILLSPAANFSMPPVVGRLRKPLPQLSLPPGVNHGLWIHQGLGARVHDTTPRAKCSLMQTSTQICLRMAFAPWAHPFTVVITYHRFLFKILSPKQPLDFGPGSMAGIHGMLLASVGFQVAGDSNSQELSQKANHFLLPVFF